MKKTHPDPESFFIFGSSTSLYKCHCLSLKNAEFRWHRWLPELEQESDSQIWKFPDLDSKILEHERSRSLKMWLRPLLPQSTDAAFSYHLTLHSLLPALYLWLQAWWNAIMGRDTKKGQKPLFSRQRRPCNSESCRTGSFRCFSRYIAQVAKMTKSEKYCNGRGNKNESSFQKRSRPPVLYSLLQRL